MTTRYHDKKGILIGWTTEQSNQIRIYDNHGICKGWYDKNLNTTYTEKGIRVGTENQITRLLPKP